MEAEGDFGATFRVKTGHCTMVHLKLGPGLVPGSQPSVVYFKLLRFFVNRLYKSCQRRDL